MAASDSSGWTGTINAGFNLRFAFLTGFAAAFLTGFFAAGLTTFFAAFLTGFFAGLLAGFFLVAIASYSIGRFTSVRQLSFHHKRKDVFQLCVR